MSIEKVSDSDRWVDQTYICTNSGFTLNVKGHHPPEEILKAFPELEGRKGAAAFLEGEGKYQESLENIRFNFIKHQTLYDDKGNKVGRSSNAKDGEERED